MTEKKVTVHMPGGRINLTNSSQLKPAMISGKKPEPEMPSSYITAAVNKASELLSKTKELDEIKRALSDNKISDQMFAQKIAAWNSRNATHRGAGTSSSTELKSTSGRTLVVFTARVDNEETVVRLAAKARTH